MSANEQTRLDPAPTTDADRRRATRRDVVRCEECECVAKHGWCVVCAAPVENN